MAGALASGLVALFVAWSLISFTMCPDCYGHRTKVIPRAPYTGYTITNIECPTCDGAGELRVLKRWSLGLARLGR